MISSCIKNSLYKNILHWLFHPFSNSSVKKKKRKTNNQAQTVPSCALDEYFSFYFASCPSRTHQNCVWQHCISNKKILCFHESLLKCCYIIRKFYWKHPAWFRMHGLVPHDISRSPKGREKVLLQTMEQVITLCWTQ